MSAKPYNGYPSWNAWNVSLWIGNDEGLYNLAKDCLNRAEADRNGQPRTKARKINKAAAIFCATVGDDKTPDGARYSLRSVRHALEGLED